MQLTPKKPTTPLSKKQIPTLLGLAILVVSLVAGVLLFGQGTGVFAPRATPETTPKNIKVTNLSDKSFTVSFYTDEATTGFVKYGQAGESLKSQATDDRDQLSGSVGTYQLHHVTVRGLAPSTSYSYTVGTASVPSFDNNGTPFSIQTFPALSAAPPANQTVYGTVVTDGGVPAEGSIVFMQAADMQELSALVKSSGSWALSAANARTTDGAEYIEFLPDSQLNYTVQGTTPGQTSVFSATVTQSQPVPEFTLGQTPVLAEEQEDATLESAEVEGLDLTDPQANLDNLLDELAEDETTASQEDQPAAVLDLTAVAVNEQPVVISEPVIKGTAAPGVTVTIEVHSDAQITQTLVANQNGEFTLDIAALSKQLEPGEHTVTYRYSDPTTGQLVTKTQTFTVAGPTNQLAQASTTGSPFGSGNPVPVTTPTPTPTPAAELMDSSSSTVVATSSGTYKSGSVENTIALIVGGLFFIIAGSWSWWLAHEVKEA